MSKIDDGGPAFPRPASENSESGSVSEGNYVAHEQEGLTVRQYFAAKAMASHAAGAIFLAMLSGVAGNLPHVDADGLKKALEGLTPELAADASYQYADAMIAAGKKTQPDPNAGLTIDTGEKGPDRKDDCGCGFKDGSFTFCSGHTPRRT